MPPNPVGVGPVGALNGSENKTNVLHLQFYNQFQYENSIKQNLSKEAKPYKNILVFSKNL